MCRTVIQLSSLIITCFFCFSAALLSLFCSCCSVSCDMCTYAQAKRATKWQRIGTLPARRASASGLLGDERQRRRRRFHGKRGVGLR